MKNKKSFLLFIVIAGLLFQQCCTTQEGSKESSKMEILKKNAQPVPRGMAELKIQIIENEESKQKLFSRVKVIEVIGIGNGVRPISSNSEYTFEVDDNLMEKIKSLIGETIEARVIQQPGGINAEAKSNYKIISLGK